jgi:hypothetical protein
MSPSPYLRRFEFRANKHLAAFSIVLAAAAVADLATAPALNGIEFEVRDRDGTHRGDLILTRKTLEWCEGKTHAGHGVQVKWNEFIDYMNS